MKQFFLLATLLSLATMHAQTDNPNYDKALAQSLGADDYGMKMYVLAILKTGSNTTMDKAKSDMAFQGHMNNIGKLVASGKLVVAGPFGKNDDNYRGIFILNVKTIAEAEQILLSDPAIQDQLLEAELYQWYGSAALSEYLKIHDRIEVKKH